MHNASHDGKCLLHYAGRYGAAMETPGERLRQARKKAGFETAKEAAEAMHIPVATYIQHENGKRVIVQRWRDDGEHETTVKEYVERNGECWLVPRSMNPAHQAFRCDLPEPGITRVEIVAIVVASIRLEH